MLTRFISPCTLDPALTPPASTATQPAFVTTYDRPFAGLGWPTHTTNPNFGKAEYIHGGELTRVPGCFARQAVRPDALLQHLRFCCILQHQWRLVIRFPYLRVRESERGETEGRKTRPVAVGVRIARPEAKMCWCCFRSPANRS